MAGHRRNKPQARKSNVVRVVPPPTAGVKPLAGRVPQKPAPAPQKVGTIPPPAAPAAPKAPAAPTPLRRLRPSTAPLPPGIAAALKPNPLPAKTPEPDVKSKTPEPAPQKPLSPPASAAQSRRELILARQRAATAEAAAKAASNPPAAPLKAISDPTTTNSNCPGCAARAAALAQRQRAQAQQQPAKAAAPAAATPPPPGGKVVRKTTSGARKTLGLYERLFGKKDKDVVAVEDEKKEAAPAPDEKTAEPAAAEPENVPIALSPLDILGDSVDVRGELAFPQDEEGNDTREPFVQAVVDNVYKYIAQFQAKMQQQLATPEQLATIVGNALNQVEYVSAIEYYALLYALVKETVAYAKTWGSKSRLLFHVVRKLFTEIVVQTFGDIEWVPSELLQVCKFFIRNDLMWFIKTDSDGNYVGLRKEKTCKNLIDAQAKFAEQRLVNLQRRQSVAADKKQKEVKPVLPPSSARVSSRVQAQLIRQHQQRQDQLATQRKAN